MTIAFRCPGCGISAKVPETFAGKKVKCKCGNVVAVKAASINLDDVSFEAVDDPVKRAATPASPKQPTLTKKQREEQVLAQRLGMDWKNPKPEYHQVDHEREHWFLEVWYAMQGSPMISLAVYSIGIIMICLGVLSFDNVAEQLEEVENFNRRRARGFLLGPILIGLGTLGASAGIFVIVMGIGSPELKQHYGKGKIAFVIGGAVFMALVLAGFIIFRAVGG